MKHFILSLFAAIVLISCQNADVKSNATVVSKIDSLMNYSYQNGLFNGTVMVSQNNEIIYRNSFGYADFDKNELLVPESSFYLASVSKQFTTMAVMILKERGELTYDDKLSDYFPDFPDYADSVTIRQMMTHTSGIPDHYRLNAYKAGLTNDDVYDILVKVEELDFKPGTKYSYSNGGYVLLSMIVEKVSGQPFHEFMKTNIFNPLEMDHTLVYDQSEPEVANRAIGYNASGKLDDYEIFTTGAGGIYSNVDNLFKWDQALNRHQLVSAETLEEAYQPTILSSGDTIPYGFGWSINQDKHWVEHSGGLSGFRTYIRRYPEKGDAFVLLTNKGDAVSFSINEALGNILANEGFELPKVRLSYKLTELVQSDGMDNAIGAAKALLAQDPDDIEYDEYGINSLGYSYLQNEDIENALKLFRFNTENRPNSANAYDSYAEALLASKDTAASIENYIASVKMNPNNQNGIDVLESLGVDIDEILPQIKLSEEQLDAFVGKYEMNADFIFEILREGDQLYIHPTGQSKSELFASSESKFYSKIVDAQITFQRDASGKVVGLTLHQGGDHEAPKID